MAKITIDKIVSLILEQINELQPPDKPIFFNTENEVLDFINKIKEPSHAEHVPAEYEMAEMANIRYTTNKLPEPLRINVEDLDPESKNVPKIVCLDPETNELVENVIIGDEVRVWPDAPDLEFLAFTNYGKSLGIDRKDYVTNYVLLPNDTFFQHRPRRNEFGTGWVKKDLSIAPEGETDQQKIKRLARISAIKESNAKRYGIFPIINDMMSRHEILDRLDTCLIPETWATTQRTEHPTNVELRKKFGGTGPDIDADFYAARDILDVNQAINDIMELRADLAMGEVADEDRGEQTFDINRQRDISAHVPRRHANYIYTKGGNWEGKQRVHDPDFFKEAGGKTRIYRLNSKNIQEGLQQLSVESILHIRGFVGGNEYVLKATFTATLNARSLTNGEGQSRGSLIDPIVVSLTKPLPDDFDPNKFSMDTNTEFFINEGRTRASGKSGFLPSLIDRLGDAILQFIDPDDVQQRIVELAEEAVEENV